MTVRRRVSAAAPPTLPKASFPALSLPLPLSYSPMEARRAETLPPGAGWQFEPKWDGFRSLVFRDHGEVALQSKAGQPLARYFPELATAFLGFPNPSFILDGEIVIRVDGRSSFNDLLQRIHPAASRIAKLSEATPATFLVFDLLYDSKKGLLVKLPLRERRQYLEAFFRKLPAKLRASFNLSPATTSRAIAEGWFADLDAIGCDGVMAKRLDEPYHSGDRDAMIKVKRLKTADCVVGGFRYGDGKAIGSLLLGLYDKQGLLNHVGFASSFTPAERRSLKKVLEPLNGGAGFSGKAPGGPSRWSTKENSEWEALTPKLVCEVRYDYFSQNRFRHGTKFMRWRPDKKAKSCTMDQVEGRTPSK